jgi:hypothetical protein
MPDDDERKGDALGGGLVISAVLILFAVAGTALAQQVKGFTP